MYRINYIVIFLLYFYLPPFPNTHTHLSEPTKEMDDFLKISFLGRDVQHPRSQLHLLMFQAEESETKSDPLSP